MEIYSACALFLTLIVWACESIRIKNVPLDPALLYTTYVLLCKIGLVGKVQIGLVGKMQIKNRACGKFAK